jgi:putative acetyltransferase
MTAEGQMTREAQMTISTLHIPSRFCYRTDMQIRAATSLDRDAIYGVCWAAFPEDERETVADLAVSLLAESTVPETLSLVAETEENVVGHVSFSPVTIGTRGNQHGYILAPLAVKPDYQKRGTGSKLVEDGLQKLSTMDVEIVFVYGDPKYYGRFGFSVDAALRYTPPYTLQYPFGWQALVLKEPKAEGAPVPISCVTSLSDPALW